MLLGHVVRICNPFVENSSPYLITPLFSGQSEFLNQAWIRAILIRMRRSSLMSRKQYLVLIMFTTEKTAWLLCVEPNMVTFLTPVEGRLMQIWVHICWEIASAEAQHSSVDLLSLYTFLFLHSMFVLFRATSLSLFRVFRHSCLCFSFSFFSIVVFLLFHCLFMCN